MVEPDLVALPSTAGNVLGRAPWTPATIAGVDPGTLVTGVAVVQDDGVRVRPIALEAVTIGRNVPRWRRIWTLFRRLVELFNQHRPTVVVLETAFFKKDAKAAFAIEQARTAAALAATQCGAEVLEYPVAYARKLVLGKGDGSKGDVQAAVIRVLEQENPSWKELPLDVSDAACLAIARIRDGGARRPRRPRRHFTRAEVRNLLGREP